ncbi:hypothetical protein [Pseudomonas aeruginosa]|uniref:hypothetical protein n=1 Tax=Pseudomonas aeruginosa TaxID=287 RepID=UPI0021E6F7D3|nr:hypothetical protein [Pseudomonas aeruginosa]MCV3817780.1 hypothetical protein [Pseudomonas aeruginosa]MCV3830341.1 hypothetical protein [Pseudomonas aeruginosa]MCV3898692.1 hypothetical protein [Pseudomonas aeruginosa]MCV3915748.1 hypothetical protein [Pseudomonas aeruginosa]MCV3923145.1 hypothetical protein [Pseudomonas aeruginosa]
MTTSKIQMDQIRSTSATVTGENIRAGSQKKSSLSPAEGLQGASPDATCTCPSGDGSLRHPCPAHPAVEQAGGDERAVDGKPRATKCPGCGEGDLMPGDLCACGYETDPAAGYACSECDGSGDGCVGEVCRECDGSGWFVTPEQARAALAQPSPASDLDPLNLAPHAEAFNEAPAEALKPEPAEADRPEVVAWQYRVTAGPQTGWSLLHPGKGEEFERSYTVERRPLMTVAQHERIVGELRAVIAQLRQHKNDYMDSGQETYRALQNEIREREAEIARLDGLVSGRTAERDAALARVAELEHVLRVVVNAADHGSWPTTVMHGIEKVREVLAGSAPPIKAQPEETPGEMLAAKLIETWVAKHGKPAPWSKIVEITALATNMPNDERDRLLALDDDVDAQAQHSVPEGFRELLEMLVVSDLRKIRYAGAWRREVHDRASSILALLTAAPGKSVPQAWLDVQAERRRQVDAEGWTPEHDDEHNGGELADAAACYALSAAGWSTYAARERWPWPLEWWKPSTARRDMVKACALGLAEIERLDRVAASQGGPSDA